LQHTEYGNLVAGEFKTSSSGQSIEDINPADTREVLGTFPSMTRDEAVEAVEAAAAAFPEWKRLSRVERGKYLFEIAKHIRERSEDLAQDITREVGKTIKEARVEVANTANFFEYYAGFGRQPQGDNLPDERPGVFTYTRHEPLGVVGLITPWNDPLLTTARKLAPALICGNTVVLKPAPDTPLATWHLAKTFTDVGLPAGVLNTVSGDAPMIGELFLEHPAVQGISFTGSTRVGNELQRRAGERSNLRIQTEMGGKNATLVLGDADFSKAAEVIAAGAFAQCGQRCTATSRVVAIEDAHEPLIEALVERAEELRIGNGLDESTEMGPLVNERQLDKVLGAVERGKDEGGTVLAGGSRLDEDGYEHGYFVAPTIVDDVSPEAWVAQEEIFGPVLSVIRAPDVERGVEIVNSTDYGLSASVFTESLAAAHYFTQNTEAGNIAVNLPTAGWSVHLPFGGFKDSGSSFKEQGREGLQFYTRVRTVAMNVASK
jgi:acyl-CoA reductase-like NAD-dependent aldehyde dehydrogenase